MSVACDKVGAGRYSDELPLDRNKDLRDQPMLPDTAALALATLSATSPRGFYLMVEGASIDKQAHESDADRTVWDTIKFGTQGFPTNPDPTRKLLIGFAGGPDRYENRLAQMGTVVGPTSRIAVANPRRDGPGADGGHLGVDRKAHPGFLLPGAMENDANGCPTSNGCPDDARANPVAIAGHTASDVPLSAESPGAWQFTGVYENTDVFVRRLRASTGSYLRPPQYGPRSATRSPTRDRGVSDRGAARVGL